MRNRILQTQLLSSKIIYLWYDIPCNSLINSIQKLVRILKFEPSVIPTLFVLFPCYFPKRWKLQRAKIDILRKNFWNWFDQWLCCTLYTILCYSKFTFSNLYIWKPNDGFYLRIHLYRICLDQFAQSLPFPLFMQFQHNAFIVERPFSC